MGAPQSLLPGRRGAIFASAAVALAAALFALALLAGGDDARAARAPSGLYPDLRTVVPTHLQIVNQQQRDILRFSNGIANTGDGPWALSPRPKAT
jgi:hypothetical protein